MSDNIDTRLFDSAPRESRVEFVIHTFERLLLQKQLKPGDRIPNEFDLTQSLRTSRGTVREALKILASYGVLEIRPGDGTYVSRSMGDRLFDHLIFQMILSNTDKKKLMELRELIEVGIVEIILSNATDEDLQQVEHEYERMAERVKERENDAKGLTELDIAFHHAIGRSTKNELIRKIYNFVLELFAPSIEETHKRENNSSNALQYHRKILDGLKARSNERASDAVRESIDQWLVLSASPSENPPSDQESTEL